MKSRKSDEKSKEQLRVKQIKLKQLKENRSYPCPYNSGNKGGRPGSVW